MSLYAVGRTTGVVCESGEGVTCTYPCYEGFSIPHAVQKTEISGRALTEYMRMLLLETGHKQGTGEWLNATSVIETARDIKQKLCYVASEY